jgi:hypothetical protein
MGLLKKIKKIVKPIAKVVAAPAYLLHDTLLKGVKGDLTKGTPGPENPYAALPNGFLGDSRALDFLKDTSKFDFLKDNNDLNFLKSPGPSNRYTSNLPSSMKSFASSYVKPTGSSDSLFQELLGQINAPSSSDDVRREVEGDRMRQLLEGTDIDTRNSIGSLKSDFADRGLSAPGVISDIEGSALAQAYGDADRTKAATRSEYALKELDRMKAKEDAVREAYGARYGAGVASDAADKSIAAQGALSDSGAYNEALLKQADLNESEIGRNMTREMTLASLLGDRKKSYADLLSGKDDLFAQLLNARDLGMAGINAGNFNAGEERKYKYAEPSFFDKMLDKVNFGISI